MIEAGVAEVDITPELPIFLSGYAVRDSECVGVERRLKAQALAIGTDEEGVSLVLTVDNVGVPAAVTEAVFARLAGRVGLAREDFSVCSTHTHHAPMLAGVLPNLFMRDISGESRERVARYTAELVERLEEVAVAALADRRAANLSWAVGAVDFAENRRTAGGPVDHGLPALFVRSPEGKLRAVFLKYACHCTTVDRYFNKTHGDWAGEAREAIKAENPGAIALVAIGCAGDQGPRAFGSVELAREYGGMISAEIRRLSRGEMRAVSGKPVGAISRFVLPFAPLPGRKDWERRAGEEGIVGYHARKNLARLDRGEVLPESLQYSVQAWVFGRDLTMLFLPGEVVVDFALRAAAEFGERVWINAYANDVPCYIPSRRILREGGYEAEESLWYYDRPARLAAGTEDLIFREIRKLLAGFRR